jgi:hypothetical protein
MSNEIMVKIGTRLSEADPKEVGWSQAQPPKVEVQAQAYTYAGASLLWLRELVLLHARLPYLQVLWTNVPEVIRIIS